MGLVRQAEEMGRVHGVRRLEEGKWVTYGTEGSASNVELAFDQGPNVLRRAEPNLYAPWRCEKCTGRQGGISK